MILLSIPEEAALCRAAFAGVKVGAMVRHCHHEQLAEPLTETPEKRIAYILSDKPIEEQALRLHLFRPTYNAAVEAAWATYDAVLDAARATYNAAVKAARATYDAVLEAAHQAECPDCPWDGRTIFPVATP